MHSLPPPLLPLIYASLGFSIITVILSAYSIHTTPFLWVVPAALFITLPFHTTTLIVARYEPHGSKRLFSSFNIIWAFFASLAWTVSFGFLLAFTIIVGLGGFPANRMIALMIIPCVTSLAECIILWWIAFASREERWRITYAAKWRPHTALNSSQTWRCVLSLFILTSLIMVFHSIGRV